MRSKRLHTVSLVDYRDAQNCVSLYDAWNSAKSLTKDMFCEGGIAVVKFDLSLSRQGRSVTAIVEPLSTEYRSSCLLLTTSRSLCINTSGKTGDRDSCIGLVSLLYGSCSIPASIHKHGFAEDRVLPLSVLRARGRSDVIELRSLDLSLNQRPVSFRYLKSLTHSRSNFKSDPEIVTSQCVLLPSSPF